MLNHKAGQLHSLDFLKALLNLARALVNTEKVVPPAEDEDRGKAALTGLFQQTRTTETPIVVERIVDDIDDIVRKIRFEGWQATDGGKREVRKALRRTLVKYQLHKHEDLFDKAYVWRTSILLRIGENTALIKADVEDRKIAIAIDGLEHTRRDALTAIRYQLDEIHRSIKGIEDGTFSWLSMYDKC